MKSTRLLRGAAAQEKRRELERSVRIDALTFAHWIEKMGFSQREAADRLKLKSGTLAEWDRRWKQDRLAIEPLGRPTRDSDWETRQLMVGLFHLVGPGIGLPCLRAFFPDASKGEVEYMLARYRRVHLRRNKVALHVLRWRKPGSIWAIDFHQPQRPVDNLYPYVFMVRDLASGKNLLSLPVPSRGLQHVTCALSALFQHLGAPLVLKSDCEFDTGRFAAGAEESNKSRETLARLLSENHVFHLLSPPYTPKYNAAIEAGIGSFQTRAHHEAARHGHAGEWNCEDVEAARLQANELARPWGHNADTPDTAWATRSPMNAEDRTDFAASVQQFEAEERQQRQQQLLDKVPLGHRDIVSCRRVAISRALNTHGFLSLRKRRITLPLNRAVWSNVL
jgi:hypothetical protein